MNITNELRESVKQTCWAMTSKAKWFAIADRIDIEHKKAVDIAFTNGRTEGIADGCAYYDTEYTECMLSEEHGWIRLPKDANGEYIRIGDVLTDDAEFKSEGKVMRLMLEDDGWMVGLGCGGWTEPSIHEWHHYHEPTVEDVLREFALEIDPSADIAVTGAETIKKFAAKLQLRGDGE